MTDFDPEELARMGVAAIDGTWTSLPLPVEIDVANAELVRLELESAVDRGYLVVIADMRCTAFCDCAGVTALRAVRQYAAGSGAELHIVARAEPVLRVFQLTGLLPISTSTDPALATSPDLDDDTGLAQPAPN